MTTATAVDIEKYEFDFNICQVWKSMKKKNMDFFGGVFLDFWPYI